MCEENNFVYVKYTIPPFFDIDLAAFYNDLKV